MAKINFAQHKKSFNSEMEFVKLYYTLIFNFYNIKVSQKEVDLVAFSTIKGTLSTPPVREEYLKTFNMSKGSMYNMLSNLQKLSIIVKDEEKKYRVNPNIVIDTTKPVILSLQIEKTNGQTTEQVS